MANLQHDHGRELLTGLAHLRTLMQGSLPGPCSTTRALLQHQHLRALTLAAPLHRPQMYVWYGRTCKPHERPRARDVAGRYLAATGRTLVPGALVEVEAGQEPPFFTCHFRGWDAGPVATIADPYEEKLKAMALKEKEKD